MLLKEYLTEINRIITDCAETGLIISSEVMTDIRTEKIGFVKGALVFLDGSTLFFKEYLDLRFRLDKKTYSWEHSQKVGMYFFLAVALFLQDIFTNSWK